MPAAATRADALRVRLSSASVKHLKAVGTIPGVVVEAVAGRNGPGSGMLRYYAGGLAAWRAPGSETFGQRVDLSAGGTYVVEDGEDLNKFLRVTSYAAFLPPGPAAARVLLQEEFNDGVGGDEVTASEAAAGSVESWTVELLNAGGLGLSNLRIWLDAATAGLEISLDNSNWYAPDSETHADVLIVAGLAAGASQNLYVRRTIASSTPADPDILNLLQFAWNGL